MYTKNFSLPLKYIENTMIIHSYHMYLTYGINVSQGDYNIDKTFIDILYKNIRNYIQFRLFNIL